MTGNDKMDWKEHLEQKSETITIKTTICPWEDEEDIRAYAQDLADRMFQTDTSTGL